MTTDLTKFKPGDRVRIEFAAPAEGWIEAEVWRVSTETTNYIQVQTGDGRQTFTMADFVSITKIEPLILNGDVVWFGGSAWYTSKVGADVYVNSTADCDSYTASVIPNSAVWLVRAGKLNPLLTEGE